MFASAVTKAEQYSSLTPSKDGLIFPPLTNRTFATFAFGQDLGLPFLVAPWNIVFQSAKNDIHGWFASSFEARLRNMPRQVDNTNPLFSKIFKITMILRFINLLEYYSILVSI
ncbi:MAG: hypothetical protein CK427_00300 [Leptospira sp.]|nr:MAG: hypothetical protein CK427_00300 [Leptospira sp.]